MNAEPGLENEVLKQLRTIAQVKESYAVYGVYDVVAMLEAKTMEEIRDIIASKVRKLNHVRSTLTMLVVS